MADPTPSDAEALIAEVTRRLRGRGDRMTEGRAAVLRVLAATPGHLSAETVAESVNALNPAAHRASVYRTLTLLCDLGVVQHVHLGHGATAYHLVPEGPHPHLECRGCGAVEDLPHTTLTSVANRLAADLGFTLDSSHVALSGLCSGCAAGFPGIGSGAVATSSQ